MSETLTTEGRVWLWSPPAGPLDLGSWEPLRAGDSLCWWAWYYAGGDQLNYDGFHPHVVWAEVSDE
jgi:hypothetical protein